MIKKFIFFLLVAAPAPALACYAADDVKYEQFEESDTNGDEKLSYEEHFNYEQKKLDKLKNDAPGAVARFFGFGRDVHEEHYKINEKFFKIHWDNSDRNKDGFWSADEFMHQTNDNRC